MYTKIIGNNRKCKETILCNQKVQADRINPNSKSIIRTCVLIDAVFYRDRKKAEKVPKYRVILLLEAPNYCLQKIVLWT